MHNMPERGGCCGKNIKEPEEKKDWKGSVEDNCCFMKNCQRKPDMATMRKDLKNVRDNESNPCIPHRVVKSPFKKGLCKCESVFVVL